MGRTESIAFAYQKNNSCINASLVLQEAVAHNVERGSKVYCCFLDSAKVVDTIWIDGLFFKLYNNGMNGKSWLLLRNWYKRQTRRVRANGLISHKFPVHQGSKDYKNSLILWNPTAVVGDSTLTQAKPLKLHLEKPPGHSTRIMQPGTGSYTMLK
ncbi:Hypothetical predicted protein [Paramuricea clavata]|uniref:Uncharacterized protein n=1 Tax=Paramuricea clavata TaxID=317549 RepID=A0A6S7KC34_PARCT|nr:Hypothetical predicted protein [Paramuricea clavata]